MNASQRRRYGRKVERINREQEDKFLPRIARSIQKKADATIARLRAGGTSAAMNYLSTDLGNPDIGAQIRSIYRNVGLLHARRVNEELKKEPKILKAITSVFQTKRLGVNDQWEKVVMDYLERFLFEKITLRINETTRDALQRVIQRGIAEGLGVDDIIRELQSWPYARFQAARIVRTEVNRAANVGAMAGGSTFQFEQQKEWIAAKDNRTRGNPMNGRDDHANHWGLDGSVVDEEVRFTDPRNGDKLEFPGDPKAKAESTINCRCTVALVAKRDERGRLIPRKSRISVIQPSQNNQRVITI